MPVLSLNSHVTYGYVGNDAAGFCLRRLGVEVWQADTVALSNHPGYGAAAGRATPAAELRALVDGVAARGALQACEAVLAGYLGAGEQADAVLHAVHLARAATPQALVLVDPVMGDAGPGLYVRPEVARAFAEQLVPAADVVTPNAFELAWLTGREVGDRAAALGAAADLLARGPRLVVVTSLPRSDDRLEMLAVSGDAAWALAVPRLAFPVAPNGAGDALAGLLTGHLVQGRAPAEALTRAANTVHAVLAATQAAGRRELALVQAQAAIADPPMRFLAEAV